MDKTSTPYENAVALYMSSELGQGISDKVAQLLYEFPPSAVGMPEVPTADQLHILRKHMDDTQADLAIRAAAQTLAQGLGCHFTESTFAYPDGRRAR
ncbi:MAG: hypothetical protein RLZZ450_2647 [Pseudomonadota bacterium]|jgi:hypothetical protein